MKDKKDFQAVTIATNELKNLLPVLKLLSLLSGSLMLYGRLT